MKGANQTMRHKLISKEDFVEVMDDLKNVNNYQEGLNKYFREHDVDGYIFQPDCACSVMKLLHLIFEEADSDEWINYFCFELDFGRKWEPGIISGKDGEPIDLSTPQALYDYL